ncbi:MAG: hypothetical protein MZU79_08760 [Anaerotruncus sp.]|nr:hypothetical protein [Anaerotruncus sp.]
MDGVRSIYIMELNGLTVHRLSTGGESYCPAWSPVRSVEGRGNMKKLAMTSGGCHPRDPWPRAAAGRRSSRKTSSIADTLVSRRVGGRSH